MLLRTRIFRAILLLAVLAVAGDAAAQTTDRSGIEGRVVDQGGGVLPGVTVTIASPAVQGGTRTTVTDGEGRYRFVALPAGMYGVTFELAGFSTVKRADIRLDTAFVATIDETLKVGSVAESVTVEAYSPVVDIRTTAVSTNLGREALEQLPTSRNMWQVMNLAPGLRVTGSDVGGTNVGSQQGYANYGTSTGGNKPLLDGVDTREDAGGAGFYYDYGAFQEVQIKAMGNDAEMSTPGTMFVGILKSGGDTFHGGGFFAWETPSLQSDNVTDELRARGVKSGNPLEAYHDGNVDLGGPILKQRLWFFGSYRHQYIRNGVVGYLESPGPDNVIGTGDDVPGHYRVTLQNTTIKLTGQASTKHRFTGFFQAQTKDMPERNGDAYRFKEATWHQIFKPFAAKVEWSWMMSDRTFTNFYVGHWKYKTTQGNYTDKAPTYDTVTLRYGGMYNTTPLVGGKGRYQYNGSVSHYVPAFWGGSHDLKAGVEMTDEDRWFNMPAREYGRDYQLRFQTGVPYQVDLSNNPYNLINEMTTQSAYVRDSWKYGERLTFNVGLRWERYHLYMPAQTKPEGRFFPGGDFPYGDVVKWNAWAPRVGMSWAIGADNRTVIKATYGWFNFATQALYADTYNRNGRATTRYRWIDLNKNLDYDDGELGAFVSGTGSSTAAVNLDMEQPKTHEITTSLEREIAAEFSARASYIFRRESGRFQNVNVLRPYSAYSVAITSTDPGPDGKLGTPDDGGPVTYYDYAASYAGIAYEQLQDVNVEGYDNSYHNIELATQKRLSKNWQMVGSFLATHVDTWRNGVPVTPNMELYPKSKYWEWGFKLSGGYELPYRIQLAAVFTSQSGSVWAREARFTAGLARLSEVILLMEDAAARRLPTQNLLAFRVEKRQKIGFGTASFQFDLFNVTNTNVEMSVTARSGTSFNQITSIVPPRVARLGVTYTF